MLETSLSDAQTGQATPQHPFAAALLARDHQALVNTLAPDVVRPILVVVAKDDPYFVITVFLRS